MTSHVRAKLPAVSATTTKITATRQVGLDRKMAAYSLALCRSIEVNWILAEIVIAMSRIEYAIGLGRGQQLDYDSTSNSNHLTDARWAAAAAAAV